MDPVPKHRGAQTNISAHLALWRSTLHIPFKDVLQEVREYVHGCGTDKCTTVTFPNRLENEYRSYITHKAI
jgi:hypothetical protein